MEPKKKSNDAGVMKKTWACTYASFKSPHCDAQIP